jgi:hypothetical protein
LGNELRVSRKKTSNTDFLSHKFAWQGDHNPRIPLRAILWRLRLRWVSSLSIARGQFAQNRSSERHFLPSGAGVSAAGGVANGGTTAATTGGSGAGAVTLAGAGPGAVAGTSEAGVRAGVVVSTGVGAGARTSGSEAGSGAGAVTFAGVGAGASPSIIGTGAGAVTSIGVGAGARGGKIGTGAGAVTSAGTGAGARSGTDGAGASGCGIGTTAFESSVRQQLRIIRISCSIFFLRVCS